MITKKKILIIEDDQPSSLYTESIFEVEKEFEILGIAKNLSEAEYMIEKKSPDVLLCNISINDLSVFQLFADNKHFNIPKIFMSTQLDDHTYSIIQLISKSTFLAKPFHKFTLLSTLNLLLEKYPIELSDNCQYIEIRNIYSQIVRLTFNEVAYIKAEGNYSIIHTSNQKKFVRKISLSQILIGLDDRFIQAQRACVVNKDYIKGMDLHTKNIIVNDTLIPIGRKYRKAIDMILVS